MKKWSRDKTIHFSTVSANAMISRKILENLKICFSLWSNLRGCKDTRDRLFYKFRRLNPFQFFLPRDTPDPNTSRIPQKLSRASEIHAKFRSACRHAAETPRTRKPLEADKLFRLILLAPKPSPASGISSTVKSALSAWTYKKLQNRRRKINIKKKVQNFRKYWNSKRIFLRFDNQC